MLHLALSYVKTNQQFNVPYWLQEFQKIILKNSDVNIGQEHGNEARPNFHTLVTSLARSESKLRLGKPNDDMLNVYDTGGPTRIQSRYRKFYIQDITMCIATEVRKCFRGIYRFHLQCRRVRRRMSETCVRLG
jgi:hypothetical protein